MNEVERFRQIQQLKAERNQWRKRAFLSAYLGLGIGLLFVLTQLGQFFYGG